MSAIVLDLLVPRVRLGFLSTSVARLPLGGGLSLASILEPLQVAPPRELGEGEQTWDVFRLRLDADQGLDVPLPMGAGRIGFFNAGGLLQVAVPGAIGGVLDGWAAYRDGEPWWEGNTRLARHRVGPDLRGRFEVLGHTIEVRAPSGPGLMLR